MLSAAPWQTDLSERNHLLTAKNKNPLYITNSLQQPWNTEPAIKFSLQLWMFPLCFWYTTPTRWLRAIMTVLLNIYLCPSLRNATVRSRRRSRRPGQQKHLLWMFGLPARSAMREFLPRRALLTQPEMSKTGGKLAMDRDRGTVISDRSVHVCALQVGRHSVFLRYVLMWSTWRLKQESRRKGVRVKAVTHQVCTEM